MGDAHWFPKRLVSVWDNSGMEDAVIQLKTDQEFSMVNIKPAVQEARERETIPINSVVGESECNGWVENAIIRVQEKTRAIRHQIEANIKQKLHIDSPIMIWLVRWAAELISKYNPGEDGRTPYERIRHEKCAVALLFFGETVLYLQMKIVRRSKGDTAKREGVWLGTIERTEEAILGTERGVIKCRTVSRLPESSRWNANNVLRMRGVPWEPVSGRIGFQIPVDIDDHGETIDL